MQYTIYRSNRFLVLRSSEGVRIENLSTTPLSNEWLQGDEANELENDLDSFPESLDKQTLIERTDHLLSQYFGRE